MNFFIELKGSPRHKGLLKKFTSSRSGGTIGTRRGALYPPNHGSLTSGSKGVLIPDLGNGMIYRKKESGIGQKGTFLVMMCACDSLVI